MWVIDKDTYKWTPNTDKLSKSDFDLLKEDIKSLRFYQNVLSGSTYVSTNDINNIYDVLNRKEAKTYNYTYDLSPYVAPYFETIDKECPISTTSSQYDFQEKLLPEYGLTLKNLFTPKRLIDDQLKNLLYVDVATTDIIADLTLEFKSLQIDGILIKEGHRILVKNQYSIITLQNTVDPNSFFDGYYELVKIDGINIQYRYYNSKNGIYSYTNSKLIRTSDLDNYQDIIKYSICVKLGTVNRETQWVLDRLKSGFFPEYLKDQSLYFKESHNYVLRNRMDYNNLFDLSLTDTLKHATQSIIKDNITYTIPERSITVGEFGVIILHQEGYSNIVPSKYKNSLKSISQTDNYYWICGDKGILLKVDKITLDINRVKLSEIVLLNNQNFDTEVQTALNSISFFNNLKGVIVGKFNQIWTTDNGGYNWKRINISDFSSFNYNISLYLSIDRFYIGGDNGVFIDFLYEGGNWTAYKRRVSKFIDEENEFLLVDDITDLSYFKSTSGFSYGTSSFIAISSTNNHLYVYDIDNSLNDNFNFAHLGTFTFSDITSISYIQSESSLFLSTFDNIYAINPFLGTYSSTQSNIILTEYVNYYTQSGINSIYNYNDELIITGNNSLWKTNLNGTFSNVYDDLFFSKLKPRMLFLDYDAGSKVYWFDDYGQYRLPEKYSVPVNYLISPNAATETIIEFKQNANIVYDNGFTQSYFDNNWITYWKDRLKTFEYYTHLSDGFKVEPSFKFTSSDYLSGIFTYSVSNLTTLYIDIEPLMPSKNSKFREGSIPITIPSSFFNLYFYGFMGIWALTIGSTHSPPTKGDVISIDCNLFSSKFIINKVISDVNGSDTTYYQYFYTDFNENIVNNLSTLNDILTIKNLNRYPTKTGGVGDFSATYSTGMQGSYTNIKSIGNTGNSATFDIEVNGAGIISSILVNNSGFGYAVNDTIKILASNFGGLSDIDLTISSIDYNSLFIENFKNHYISNGYDISLVSDYYPKPESSPIGITQSFQIIGKYSQYSAYYNLQANIEVLNTDGYLLEEDIKYINSFLNFGYTPTYNLLSYLNFIDDKKYSPNKEFLALPKYDNIPGPDSGIADTNIINDNIVYVDFIVGSYSSKYESNKLFFGVNLKPIWDSFLKWTFIDIEIIEGISYPPDSSNNITKTEKLIIINKYYDDTTYDEPYYVLEFHDRFTANNNDVSAITIHSRRTLQQISDDLQYINGLQRPKWSEKTIETGYYYTNYETNIGFKLSTDSYAKALLSDSQLFEDISSIIYTDFKFDLAIQIVQLDKKLNYLVSSVVKSLNSKYQLSLPNKHNLKTGDGISINIIGTYSNWPNLLGYHTINKLNDYVIELNLDWVGFLPSDKLEVSYLKKDPFLNFEPIDIFDIGVGDKKVKQSIQILSDNWSINNGNYYLKNIDFNKFRFKLVDGLDLVKLSEDFYWILDAEVSEAIIGMDSNKKIIWYKGTWEGGRWFDGTWISGTWISGDWYDGTWTSKSIADNALNIKIDNTNTNELNSIWYTGRWFDGTWENGTWYNGRWYNGDWKNGKWYDGTWNNGNWYNGAFSGGIWILGTWYNGKFNTDSSLSYWIDGKFLGGDFENGIWYNGEFNERHSKSRFGTKSFNSRNANWYGGKFLKGEFHSFLNINDKNIPDVSEIHQYSNWYSGIFSGGTFYGGNVFNINFNLSVWKGGILNDIDIVAIKSNDIYNHFVLDGIYRFNIGDKFYITDNLKTGTYSVFGSTNEPKKYLILDTTIDEDANTTELFVDVRLSDIMSVNTGITNTGLKCVSIFKNSTWNSGIWFNGVFDGGHYNGGMWYNGTFLSGTWG